MHRKRYLFTLAAAFTLVLGGTAYALTVTPQGGPPDSTYQVTVSCDSQPRVYVEDLDAAGPPATILPSEGVESSPGVWTYDLQSGDVDQWITSRCGDSTEHFRYNVDEPRLFPGPTYADYPAPTSNVIGAAVVGTDCPAGTTATATITGPGGYSVTKTASIDTYGNWQVDVPDDAPTGDLTINATCGDLTYQPIVMSHRGASSPPMSGPATTIGAASTSTSVAPSTATSANGTAPAAKPIVTDPQYTG